MIGCDYCRVPVSGEDTRCWTCPARDPEVIGAMNDWLRFYVQEIRSGRVCGDRNIDSHRRLDTTSGSCPCYLFENRTETHDLLDCITCRSQVPYATLLAPPVELLLKDAGLTSTGITAERYIESIPIGEKSKSKRARAKAKALADGYSGEICTWDRCPICLVNSRQGLPTVETPSPIDTRRLGWGVEMETYLPKDLIKVDCGYCNHSCYNCSDRRHCRHRERCCGNSDGEIYIGSYHHGIEITQPGAPEGWNAQQDGSLETGKRDYTGVEIVSPILKGRSGLESVRQMSEFLQPHNPFQNHKSGLHCHVAVDDASAYELYLMRFLFAHLELAFYASCGGLASRRFMSEYCAPSTTWLPGRPAGDRRRTLNMCNIPFHLKDNSGGHAEIRIWPGTTKYNTVAMAVHMAVALVGATHDHWLPADDLPLNDVQGATRGMCDLIELYPVAETADTQIAIATLERRSRSCDLSAPAIRTYARDKDAVLP